MDVNAAWTRFMTWKYPVDVVKTSKAAYEVAGVAAAALSGGRT